jgi:hypothetical protein
MSANKKSQLFMKKHWAEYFKRLIELEGNNCESKYSNGWLETIIVDGRHKYFMKSFTYNLSSRQYFLGVDHKKLNEDGDAVILCGGKENKLTDVFIIPWKIFFDLLIQAAPENSYKARTYLQYKSHIRDRSNAWIISLQGGSRPKLNISKYRFDPQAALKILLQF